ncbi:hypothetical protein BX666DRAFT_1936765 [Dichotomocladium elegans]|nr:hypothetical protein BX666DRAFT_1936765 [Dichotomocladium elegans]
MPVQAPVAQQTTAPAETSPPVDTHALNTKMPTTVKTGVQNRNTAVDDTDNSEEASKTTSLLENNEDYKATVAALNVLRQQLQIATKDVETLCTLKEDALKRPFEFLAELKQKKSRRRVPKLQKIAYVPTIDWSKYRYVPEHRIAEQAATISSLMQNLSRQPAPRSILDACGPFQREEPASPSATVSQMQREMARVSRIVGQVPSRAASVSDLSDRDSEDEGNEPGRGKGKGKRRMSLAQPGTMVLSEQRMVSNQTNSYESSRASEMEEDSNAESRAPTYNQPWTDEEQRRLEELLEIYPDEQVQSQRFHKISKALGTRTTKQVASRVQKYFIKLAKLGLPVPGRVSIPPSSIPKGPRVGGGGFKKGKIAKPKGKVGSSNTIRTPKPAMRTSGVGYNAMVSGGITNTRISGAHYLTAQAPPAALMSDDEEDTNIKETMLRVAKPASGEATAGSETVAGEVAVHEGYACDGCGIEPIVGVRYKCTICDISEEIDLCSKCMAQGTFRNDHHTPEHPFEAVHVANALPYYADTDYASSYNLGEYSYLGI